MLEIAEGPVRARIVAQGRAAGFDRLPQHLAHRLGQPLQAHRGDPARRGGGRDARAVQGLADIDVAEPGDDALVEQGGLHVLDLPRERLLEVLRAELRPQRLGAQAREPGMIGQLRGRDQVHVAEPAGVEIGDPPSPVGVEDHVGVFVLRRGFLAEDPGPAAVGALDLEAAGHAQVHHQGVAPVERPEQVLGPPLKSVDPGAGEPLDEPLGQRKAQVWPARLDPLQPRPLQGRLQAASDRLDFRKLGHVQP